MGGGSSKKDKGKQSDYHKKQHNLNTPTSLQDHQGWSPDHQGRQIQAHRSGSNVRVDNKPHERSMTPVKTEIPRSHGQAWPNTPSYSENQRPQPSYEELMKANQKLQDDLKGANSKLKTYKSPPFSKEGMEATLKHYVENNDKLNKDNAKLNQKLSLQDKQNVKLTAGNAQLTNEVEELKRQLRDCGTAKEEVLTNMSSMMHQKMARDESDLENINVKNRPMTVMDAFTTFCSQEWLEAKQVLDDWAVENPKSEMSERAMLQLLIDAMNQCYQFSHGLMEAIKQHIESIIDDPLQEQVLTRSQIASFLKETSYPRKGPRISTVTGKQEKRSSLDVDFQVMLTKELKRNSDRVNFKACAKDFAEKFLQSRYQSNYEAMYAENKDIQAFFTQCLIITWNMAIQQPPMKFICDPPPGNKYDDLKHEPHYGSADPKDDRAIILCYVHPALFHGTKQMKKARVLLTVEAWSGMERSQVNQPHLRHPKTPATDLHDAPNAPTTTKPTTTSRIDSASTNAPPPNKPLPESSSTGAHITLVTVGDDPSSRTHTQHMNVPQQHAPVGPQGDGQSSTHGVPSESKANNNSGTGTKRKKKNKNMKNK